MYDALGQGVPLEFLHTLIRYFSYGLKLKNEKKKKMRISSIYRYELLVKGNKVILVLCHSTYRYTIYGRRRDTRTM